MALLVHLLFAAFVAPFVGALFFCGSVIASLSRNIGNESVVLILLIWPWFAPFLGWFVFVPAGCLSFLFFRATATRHAKGKAFWVVAWALIGAATGAAYAFTTTGYGPTTVYFICSGAAAGLVLAPLHRRVWIGLYPEADPRFHTSESSAIVRA